MEYEAVVRGRSSVRHYRDEVLDQRTINELIEEASWAPSGGNLQPWRVLILPPQQVRHFLLRFESDALELVRPGAKLAAIESAKREGQTVNVKDIHQKLELGQQAHQMLSDPPSHLLVVYTEKETLRYIAGAIRLWGSLFLFRLRKKPGIWEKLQYLRLMLFSFPALWASFRQVRIVSVSGFVHTLVLSAFNRGIASCIHASFLQIQGALRRYLGLRRHHKIVAIISLGYPTEQVESPRVRWKVDAKMYSG